MTFARREEEDRRDLTQRRQDAKKKGEREKAGPRLPALLSPPLFLSCFAAWRLCVRLFFFPPPSSFLKK
jgi:hypothetical protein